jgi:PAS domain S-box-containing protein
MAEDSGSHSPEGSGVEEGCQDPFQELSPERFQAVVQSISDGVMTVDRDWRITCFNRAAEEITGHRQSDVLGRFCFEVLRSDLCRDACPIRHTLETGVPVGGLVVYISDRNGNKCPVSVSTALFCDSDGRLLGGVETFRDLRQVEALKKKVEGRFSPVDIVTKNPRVQALLDLLPVVAESESTVLIRGETGTGKELLARAIHNLSPRNEGPFVGVNCACFPETLVESELFGFEKGAFTGAHRKKPGRFAMAEKGTLFLDEVGGLPLPTQAKLLRVLQNRTYEPLGATDSVRTDARIITATNQDLPAMVEAGDFRRDLFYRIDVIELDLPPLRERPEDILPLIRHFLDHLSLVHERPIQGVTPDALSILMAHDYPGNIRELENVIEHGFVLSRGLLIGVEHLPAGLARHPSPPPSGASLEECQRAAILAALERNSWNRLATAKELGIHKSTLFRKIKRFGIQPPHAQPDGD